MIPLGILNQQRLGGPVEANPGTDNLVSYYAFRNSTADNYGNNTLLAVNGPTYVPSIQNKGMSFDASSLQYLHDNAASTGLGGRTTPYSMIIWAKMSAITSYATLVSKGHSGSSIDYSLLYNNVTARFEFYVNEGSTNYYAAATDFGAVTLDEWVMLYCEWDGTNIGISVNAGTKNTAVGSSSPTTTSTHFTIGAAYGLGRYFEGVLDEFAYFDRVLTSAEVEWMYNAGTGRDLGDLVGLQDTLYDKVVAWFPFDEVSGTRYDAHSTTKAYETNTVPAVDGVYNSAAQFNKANAEYLEVSAPHVMAGQDETDFSFAFHYRPLSATSFDGVVHCGTSEVAGNTDWMVVINSSVLYFYIGWGGSWYSAVSTQLVNSQDTHHVYCEFDATAMKIGISVNREPLVQTSVFGINTVSNASVWFGLYKGYQYGDCEIDEFAFFNAKLTYAERLQHEWGTYADLAQAKAGNLASKIIHWIAFDEAGGTASDASGNGMSLTNQAVANLADGLKNAGADYSVSTTAGHYTGSHLLGSQTVFSHFVWVQLAATGSDQCISVLGNSTANANLGFKLRVNSSNLLEWNVYSGSTAYTVTASTHGTVSTGEWYGVLVYFDGVNNEIGISVNGGTRDTAAGPSSYNTFANYFQHGLALNNTEPLYGYLDESAWFDEVITTDEEIILNTGPSFDELLVYSPEISSLSEIPDLLIHLNAANRGSTALTWDDLSGNDNHFVASSASVFPSFSSGKASFGVGGQDYLTWDGWDGTGITGMEVFVILKRDPSATATGTDSGSFAYVCGGTDHYTYSNQIYNSFFSTSRKSCGTPAIDVDAVFHVANFWSENANWGCRINDAVQYSVGSNTFNASPAANSLTIGASSNSGGYYFYGEIAQVAFFSRKLTTTENYQVRKLLQKQAALL